MFKGRLTQKPCTLSRSQRRWAVVNRRTALRSLGGDRTGNTGEWASVATTPNTRTDTFVRGNSNAPHRRRPGHGHGGDASEKALWTPAVGSDSGSRSRTHYDDVDSYSGDSIVQLRFNELVHAALLRFGPPLPPEFVAANEVVTSSSRWERNSGGESGESGMWSSRTGGKCRASWQQDLAADGRSFLMYDEVALETHELLHAMRRHRPDFSLQRDCDGVPFSVLIRNCSYLRAFGGKVNYMRYLRREQNGDDSHVVVSIAKYKMREAASQDGVRQGPQPWKYSYKMM